MSDFVHLHVHSEYSLLDGMSTPEEMARAASTNGQTSIAITDHGSMAGVLKFQDACRGQNVKPIFGIEAYFTPRLSDDHLDEKTERFHLILLAKNNDGLKKLFRLNKEAWTKGFYYKPRMDFGMLENMVGNDIIALSGCRGSSIAKAIENDDSDRAERLTKKFIDIFGDDFYFEIQSWNPEKINKGLISLAESYGKIIVPTLDCHYPFKSDAGIEEVLLTVAQYPSMSAADKRHAVEHNDCATHSGMDLIKKINTLYPERRLRFDDIQPWIMNASDVKDMFVNLGYGAEYLENTLEVADKCNAELSTKNSLLPKYNDKFDSIWYLKEIAEVSLFSRNLGEEYKSRLKEELNIIEQTGFADYFLIIWDLVNWARNNNIGVGPGRGSVGGSLLAYLLGITIVDPIEHGLLFARFINPDRNDYPDIDLDFEDKRRGEVKQYLKDKWGEDHVASISTFGVYKAKSAVKDVARVFGVDYKEINGITQLFESLDEMNRNNKVREFCTKYVDVHPVAERLEGRVRNAGMHAAGVVVSSKPLWQVCPIESRKESTADYRTDVTAFDMEDAEEVGLIKIDILGLKMVSVIKDCFKKIQETYNLDDDTLTALEEDSLALDEQFVYEQFDIAETTGVFQADAAAYRGLLDRMPCESFDDLVISNALVRPGALLTQGDEFVKRRSGSKIVKYKHEVLEPILNGTYGTFIFQEQLMQAVVALAGFTWSDADKLRKIIGKKRDVLEFEKYRDKFVVNNLMDEDDAQKMWDDFEVASLYMFNKSHAVAYSMLSYQSMWLKVLYPVEFCWALLYNETNRERITAYLLEAKRLGIEIEPPDVNLSDMFFSVDGGSIRFGLSNVDGVGVGAIDEVLMKRPFASLEEMTGRCEKRKLRSNVLENLDKVGALSSLGHVSEFDHRKYYMPLLGFPIADSVDESGDFTPASEVDDDNIAMHFVKAVVRSVKRTPSYVRIEFEDPTGSFTVFADLDNELKKRDYVNALVGDRTLHCYADATETVNEVTDLMDMVASGLDHDHAWLYDHDLGTMGDGKALVKVVNVRAFKTAKGKMMASVYVWDGNGFHKIVIFPYLYGRYAQKLSKLEGKWVAVKPTPISKDDEGYKIDGAEAIIDINDYCRRMNINVSN